ncbi:MAG: CBS domain-containing protein [Mariprofundaceae bacterium]
MVVRDVMTAGVLTASKTDSVRSVVTKMLSRHCGAIPVVDDDNNLVGVVAVRDVLLPLYPSQGDYIHDSIHSRDFVSMEEGYAKAMDLNVEDVMTARPLTTSPDEPVLKAASFMGLKNFRRIPVTADGKLVGMLSIGDINRALFFS